MTLRLGSSTAATIAVDARGTIVAWNKAAEQILGWPATEALGRPCHELMHGFAPGGVPICGPDCAVAHVCAQGHTPRRFEMVLHRPDGTEMWFDVTTVTIDDDGRPVGVHVFEESVSSQRLSAMAADVVRRLTDEQRPTNGKADERTYRRIVDALTPREIEVLKLVASGNTTDQIARRLKLSRATIRNHIYNLLPKLGVHSRVEATVLAFKAGLIHLP